MEEESRRRKEVDGGGRILVLLSFGKLTRACFRGVARSASDETGDALQPSPVAERQAPLIGNPNRETEPT